MRFKSKAFKKSFKHSDNLNPLTTTKTILSYILYKKKICKTNRLHTEETDMESSLPSSGVLGGVTG